MRLSKTEIIGLLTEIFGVLVFLANNACKAQKTRSSRRCKKMRLSKAEIIGLLTEISGVLIFLGILFAVTLLFAR